MNIPELHSLNLNNPKDARRYVMSWVDQDSLSCEDPKLFLTGTDEDFILVAKQLFLFCDPRAILGGIH